MKIDGGETELWNMLAVEMAVEPSVWGCEILKGSEVSVGMGGRFRGSMERIC